MRHDRQNVWPHASVVGSWKVDPHRAHANSLFWPSMVAYANHSDGLSFYAYSGRLQAAEALPSGPACHIANVARHRSQPHDLTMLLPCRPDSMRTLASLLS